MKMTEKIIIDGIDVSGCEYIYNTDFEFDTHVQCMEIITKNIRCRNNPNCYYKQLQRTTSQYNTVVEQNKSLQTELKQKTQECEELKKSIMKQCPICGEKFLSPIGMELYDKNTRYKQALDEIENIVNELHYSTLYFHSGKTHTLADRIQKTRNQILDIINKADFGKSETRLGESFDEKVEPPIIQEAKEVNNERNVL